MPELSFDLIVAAPADRVWAVIGPGFARIGEWATVIPASTALPTSSAVPDDGGPTPVAGAPVAGRVCETGIRPVPRAVETLVAYDDAARTLTYEAGGLPSFVTMARNTWTVTAAGPRSCRVSLRARFDTRGLLGLVCRWAILARARRTGRHLADDLRHYAETGRPSPRKRRRLSVDSR